jgi:hypothetical protein
MRGIHGEGKGQPGFSEKLKQKGAQAVKGVVVSDP